MLLLLLAEEKKNAVSDHSQNHGLILTRREKKILSVSKTGIISSFRFGKKKTPSATQIRANILFGKKKRHQLPNLIIVILLISPLTHFYIILNWINLF